MAPGTNAVAVPFGGEGRAAIGSLTVAGPDSRLAESRCMALVPLLREHGERLARSVT
jgi:DNA-binding IclR family transcriptional regulator